jgi:hypothetical protein
MRIRIGNPDPGRQKLPTKKVKKFNVLKCCMFFVRGLEASPLACKALHRGLRINYFIFSKCLFSKYKMF